MSDEDLKELDLKAVNTIILCLADEVMYYAMDEETNIGMDQVGEAVHDKDPLQCAKLYSCT